MTKEEIVSMKPGRELNKAVAQFVMGHTVIVDEIFGEIERSSTSDDSSKYASLQSYSEDMSAAQLVIDRMISTGHQEAALWKNYGNGIYTQAEAICKAALLVVLGIWDKQDETSLSSKKNEDRQKLLDEIIKLELDMFVQVRTNEPSLCQERPDTFKAMRRMTHIVLSTNTLQSYLIDLQKAKPDGRNLLTEKYARMDGRIPPLKENRLIGDIVKIEKAWMRELSEKYPYSFNTGPGNFEIYLSSELETYSDETLKLYFADIDRAVKEGRNLAEERFAELSRQLGHIAIGDTNTINN